MNVKQSGIRAANFFRLLDENGELSLTNIAVTIVLVRLALAADINIADVSALLGVLGGYSFKRYVRKDIPRKGHAGDCSEQLKALEDKLSRLELVVGIKGGR